MNKIKNVLEMYGHTWIILADKRLSLHDRTNAVNNCIALNEGRFDFKTSTTVVFNLDEMKPLSEADHNSPGT